MGIGDWGLGIGDWGLGIGDWAQSPIPIHLLYNLFIFYIYQIKFRKKDFYIYTFIYKLNM